MERNIFLYKEKQANIWEKYISRLLKCSVAKSTAYGELESLECVNCIGLNKFCWSSIFYNFLIYSTRRSPAKLARHSCHSRWHATLATHASTTSTLAPHQRHPSWHVTYVSMPSTPLTLAFHPRYTCWLVPHVSTLLLLTKLISLACFHTTHATRASTYSTPFLKLFCISVTDNPECIMTPAVFVFTLYTGISFTGILFI